ncbi:MAG: type II toxin-antitoxin system VapC family toxin [Chloroflexi bacterium]|nr:type II toxin-antitoxin system VapC family toxin [Chloroflexota bacterium]
MPIKVVDSSIAIAVAFLEPGWEDALRSVEGATLFAPHLFDYEVANVTRTKLARRPELWVQYALALSRAVQLDIERRPVQAQVALGLALTVGLSAYDASYLALARELGGQLATLDGRLARAASQVLEAVHAQCFT